MNTFSRVFYSTLFLFIGFSCFSQEDIEFLEAYEDYTDAPREVVYLHLNKSTFFIGETIGFSAYVLDKKSKKPSLLTTNLYVSIEDKTQNIIKQKLIMVNNGVASNTFEVDSVFSNGNYTIKAYTKWMLNFNEQNYFIESIKIKDQKVKENDNEQLLSNSIDAQFLPESGHLLDGVENNIGVVIKDKNGYGVPFAEGKVIDKNGSVLTTFKTNKLGLGKFLLIPDSENAYKINLSDYEENFNLNQTIERNGVILSVKRLKEKFYISVITNSSTLSSIKNKRYSLLLHNGETYDLMDIYFNDDTKVTKVIELDDSAGINIFTLFNEDDQPIAERLVFNYNGIPILKPEPKTALIKSKDSISINLNFKDIDNTQFNNISVSVLPRETKSYLRHHNLLSYTFLQPYLNGMIENGKYYFTDINEKKKFELDNLLMTQGWSSYNWNNIFNSNPNLTHEFEQGITVKANFPSKNINDTNTPNQLMYYLYNEGFMISEPRPDENSYVLETLFPVENDALKLSEVAKNGLKPASLYLQFFPSKIPRLNIANISLLDIKEPDDIVQVNNYKSKVVFKSSKNLQKLDEVVVKSNGTLEKKDRLNELSSGRFGRVTVVDKDIENSIPFLRNFLEGRGIIVVENPSGVRAYYPSSSKAGGALIGGAIGYLTFFLDDMLLIDTFMLTRYSMSNIDFIEINRFGTGEGMRAPYGYVKIYTKDLGSRYSSKTITKAYKFPLAFSEQKKFYVPEYRYYNDDFFKDYGVIDWKPELKIDNQGNVSFKILKPQVPITLFIEGIANDGSFIFEEKTISLN